MNLLGVDVGFSARRATTGIAYLQGDRFDVVRVTSSQADRRAVLPKNFMAHALAIDGPVLPPGAAPALARICERVFIRDAFHNRCKPGLSHYGFGLQLRQASAHTQRHFGDFVVQGAATVEAFPNLFLGVLTPGHHFERDPPPRPRRRFDWLYDRVAATRAVERALLAYAALPQSVWDRLANEHDHEKRAALVCLITAALAANGSSAKVGDDDGGWFWLPPVEVWQPWAKETLERIVAGAQFPTLQVTPNDLSDRRKGRNSGPEL